MADYISRGDVLEIAMQYCPDDDGSCSKAVVDLREMLDEIEGLEAADVPVKHGRWEKKKGYLVCNNCGMVVDTIGYTYEEQDEVFRYCSCCGFRMDGEQNDT